MKRTRSCLVVALLVAGVSSCGGPSNDETLTARAEGLGAEIEQLRAALADGDSPDEVPFERPGPGDALVSAGGVVRVKVAQAVGAKTVIGQLTVDGATSSGFVTAYACDGGVPKSAAGEITRSDVNYSAVSPVSSNRLIVQADADGEVCFYTSAPVEMIVDINAVSDTGITSFTNQRTDTRASSGPVSAGGVVRVKVAQAVGAKTVIGQLTVDGATSSGFVTAYACDGGVPKSAAGEITRSDVNYSAVSPVSSNRLIVQADADGEVCFYTSAPVEMIVDINAVSDTGITSFTNQRTDTRGIERAGVCGWRGAREGCSGRRRQDGDRAVDRRWRNLERIRDGLRM